MLVLAPHPDDEVLGTGGLIQQVAAAEAPIRVVFLTNGDNNEWSFAMYRRHPVLLPDAVRAMGLVRHDEAIAAARVLGLGPSQLTFLGYPDFGTLEIWTAHWRDRPPFTSMLTRASAVPYANALRPGAPYKGEEILRDLVGIIREFRPTKVVLSHCADHNPDHRALYLYTRIALWDLEPAMRPALLPVLIHFGGWPKPRGLHPDEPLEPPAALAGQVPWSVLRLTAVERVRKRRALEAHVTQFRYSPDYLLSFARTTELFGDLPVLTLEAEAGKPAQDPRFVRREGDAVVMSTALSRPLAQAAGASFYLFGYRRDRSFAAMPKLHVEVGLLGHQVSDQSRRLPAETVEVTRDARVIAVRVPLDALGRPERLLVNARRYLTPVPLDTTPWRVVELGTVP